IHFCVLPRGALWTNRACHFRGGILPTHSRLPGGVLAEANKHSSCHRSTQHSRRGSIIWSPSLADPHFSRGRGCFCTVLVCRAVGILRSRLPAFHVGDCSNRF